MGYEVETSASAVKSLFGLSVVELRGLMESLGQPAYRGKQLGVGLYQQRVESLDEITTLPAGVRGALRDAGYGVGLPVLAQTAKSVDGTERYLVRLADGETVETVWMPGGDGGERGDGSVAAAEEEGEEIGDGVDPLIARNAMNGARNGGRGNGRSAEADSSASLRNDNKEGFWNDKQDLRDDKRGGGTGVASPAAGAGRGEHPTLPDKARKDGAPDVAPAALSAGRGEHPTLSDKARKDGAPGSVPGYKRATICVSSQVGCAVNCQFCLTAKLGIKRNLTAGEIAGQVAAVLNRHGVELRTGASPDRINLVFMGMGEPFLNYDAFMDAVRLLVGEMGIPAPRMTVSTSGIEPAIRRFAGETVRPKLALSLNASNDVVREQIMPITRKWNIAALLDAVKSIPFGKREYVTFEYVLLGGVNDQPEHAAEVLKLLKGMNAKVNLIVWNPGPGVAYTQPTEEAADRFHKLLIGGGIPAFTRRPRGRDIYAACGQLKRTVEDMPGGGLVEISAGLSAGSRE